MLLSEAYQNVSVFKSNHILVLRNLIKNETYPRFLSSFLICLMACIVFSNEIIMWPQYRLPLIQSWMKRWAVNRLENFCCGIKSNCYLSRKHNLQSFANTQYFTFYLVQHYAMSGLHNSESSKGQIDQHKLAAGHKSLFRHSVEEILEGQAIIPSRAFATFSATEFSRAARKDLAGRMWPAGRMLYRPALCCL